MEDSDRLSDRTNPPSDAKGSEQPGCLFSFLGSIAGAVLGAVCGVLLYRAERRSGGGRFAEISIFAEYLFTWGFIGALVGAVAGFVLLCLLDKKK